MLDYSEGAQAINLVTDASLTGASGYICQGDDVLTAKVIMFWSGKFNSAQQNYPVHEQELLAIVESLKRFRHLLYGTNFRICTDHESLEHLMNQKNLSPRQHGWMDILNEFRYKIHYIPGEMNVLADALSRLYSDEPAGIVRATSEYISRDSSDDEHEDKGVDILRPVYTGAAAILDGQPRRSAHLAERPVPEGAYRVLHEGTAGRARRKDPQPKSSRPRVSVEDAVTAEDASSKSEDRPTRSSPSMISTAGDTGMQLPGGFRGRYSEDPYFRKIVSSPSDHPLFEYNDGLLYKRHGDTYLLCVPDILVGSRRVREILIRHTHSILAHLGY